jgi:hypothetical protein
MFNTYNPKGNMYVIESSVNNKIKFQIHYASNQLKDASDKEIEFDKMINLLSDELKTKVSDDELKILQEESVKVIHDLIFNDIYKKANENGILDLTSAMLNKFKYYNKYIKEIFEKLVDKLKNIEVIVGYDTIEILDIPSFIKTLQISRNLDDDDYIPINFKLEDYQYKLINLEKLYLLNFDGEIGNLNNLPNLTELHFCIKNDEYSSVKFKPTDSFSNLQNLTLLSLPYNFNEYDGLFHNEKLMKHLKVIKIGKLDKEDIFKFRSVLKKLDKIYINPYYKEKLDELGYELDEIDYDLKNLDSTGMPYVIPRVIGINGTNGTNSTNNNLPEPEDW